MDLLYMFFDATNMHRWNDHIRPLDLTELDKQSHKAAIAWVLGKSWEEGSGQAIDWRRLIEHSVFSLIERCVMTDIKPPLFHRIKAEKASEMADFVISEVRRIVPRLDNSFAQRLENYLHSKNDTIEDELLRAAHYLATHWEFSLIYDLNKRMVGIDQTRDDIEAEIGYHDNVISHMRKVMGNDDFIDLIGQLRFQQRWTRTPRMPVTTVLGHSLLVANSVFLNDLDKGVDDRTLYNDYYAALFHDLPEVLTKDVITPVKMNVGGLSELLESYEEEMVESKLMPMIPESWRDEFRFILYDPFGDKDDPRFGKLMGRDIKAADLIAAYMEARLSRYYGITSRVLKDAEASSLKRLSRYMTFMDVNGLLQDLERICE
ncbi:MAG: HD domain-containing protein [Candidatus Methanomethylophilaceae archaeon]|nr:HD domain-containing protein [Candidatus Methanomethylophilaceae archaeon]